VRSCWEHRRDPRGDIRLNVRVPRPMPTAVGADTDSCGSVKHVHTSRRCRRARRAALTVTSLTVCCSLAACGGLTGSNGVAAGASGVAVSGRTLTEPTIRSVGPASRTAQDARPAPPVAQGAPLNNPAFRQTLAKFYECLRRSSVMVPSSKADSGTIPIIGIMKRNSRPTAWARCRRSVDLGTAYFYRPTTGEHGGGRSP
jgi:hypothetical protein